VSGITPSDSVKTSQQKLCYYCNRTPKVQVGLISNIPGQRLEQVLFPGQRWMFWATPEAVLAIYDSGNLAQSQVEHIPCERLQVTETDRLD
jgi:hypothetical protein